METLKLSPFRKLLHTLMSLSKKDVNRRFAKAKINISQLQYWVLAASKPKAITVNEIARQFSIKPPSLIPVVDALEKEDLLQRKNDPKDRRRILLLITKKGKALIHKISFDDKKDGLNAAFDKLSADKQKHLLSILQELITHFQYYD